ncbi:MAG: hypothetical protein WB816_14530 [Methylocystis sp.]
MSSYVTAAMALAALFATAGQPRAQEAAPTCNPKVGHPNARIECLTRMMTSLNGKVEELQSELGKRAKSADSSTYLRRSEFDAVIADYVKYKSPVAINLALEPSSGQKDGRCLEAFSGQVGVMVRKPCDFDTKPQLKWLFLPVEQLSSASR